IRQYAQTAHEVLRQSEGDPLAPEAIYQYFSRLYWQKGNHELDAHDLMGLLARSAPDSLPMETLEQQFRMIEDTQIPVIVPWRAAADDRTIDELLTSLEYAEHCGGIARKLQPYLVPVPRNGFDALHKAGAVVAVAPEKWGQQFMMLAHEGLYDSAFGLSWDEPALIDVAHLHW